MSDIKLVKLKSGEELIGDVTVVGDSVAIANPCQIIPTQDGMGFAPWPPFSKNSNVTIKTDLFLFADLAAFSTITNVFPDRAAPLNLQ